MEANLYCTDKFSFVTGAKLAIVFILNIEKNGSFLSFYKKAGLKTSPPGPGQTHLSLVLTLVDKTIVVNLNK